MLQRVVKVNELKLRDTVSLNNPRNSEPWPFMTATVYKVTQERVYLWRPYVSTSEFETTAGVIPYIGIEDLELWRGDSREIVLLESRPVK